MYSTKMNIPSSSGNVSYSLYTHNNNNNTRESHRMTDTEVVDIYPSKKKSKKVDHPVAPVITLEMPD